MNERRTDSPPSIRSTDVKKTITTMPLAVTPSSRMDLTDIPASNDLTGCAELQESLRALPNANPGCSCRRYPQRLRGFSLLEILVAFSIMAVSLGILLKIFSSGVNTAEVAEEYTIATQIAEALMATTGVVTPLTPGDSDGTEAEKYHWRVSVREIPALPDVEHTEAVLLEVNVTVQWGDEEFGRRVELNTVKAGSAG